MAEAQIEVVGDENDPLPRCENCGALTAPVADKLRQHFLGLQQRLGRQVTSGRQGPVIIFDGDVRLLHMFVNALVDQDNKCRGIPCASASMVP